MQTRPDFTGLWIPLITPFLHGTVDHPALTRLVKHLANLLRVPLSARLGVEPRSSEVPTASIVNHFDRSE